MVIGGMCAQPEGKKKKMERRPHVNVSTLVETLQVA